MPEKPIIPPPIYWYDLLCSQEFIDHFSQPQNTFFYEENGERRRLPMTDAYYGIVEGICTYLQLEDPSNRDGRVWKITECFIRAWPLRYVGFCYCRDVMKGKPHLQLKEIFRTLREKEEKLNTKTWYDIPPEKLTAEEVAVILMYPFWSRMGGSFECDFYESGNLIKYMKLLKEKRDANAARDRGEE